MPVGIAAGLRVTGDAMRRVRKGLRLLADKGPRHALRETAYNYYYHRHERIRGRALLNGISGPTTISLFGDDFELHPSMKGINESLYLFGAHEPIASAIYSKLLAPGGHVIDVGSNIGYFLRLARQAIDDSGTILGFEPVPGNFEILTRNVRRMRQPNIQIFPWAIGERNETAQFYESQVPNWGSLIRNDSLLPKGVIPVEVKTLDNILKDFPSFRPTALRMDVDGGELMILSGAGQLLRKYRPLLFIEFHTFALGWEKIQRALLELRELGYSQGFLIDRLWDQPWIGKWFRERRWWSGVAEYHLDTLTSLASALPIFTLILPGSAIGLNARGVGNLSQ
jgi:FkbM family methyltransferase